MNNEWDKFYEKDLKDDKESAKRESMGDYEHLKVRNLEKGIINENLIVKSIKERTDFIITQKHTNGVDIKAKNNFMEISIEVKSANYWVSDGIHKYRKGKFYFYTGNLSKPDYYAFVINYPTKDKTYWVRRSEIIKYFKNHNKKKNKLSLSIPALLRNVRRIDFSQVIKK